MAREAERGGLTESMTEAAEMRVFKLLLGGRVLGVLGSEPGQYESHDGGSELGPPACSYRSFNAETEVSILELLHSATEFDALLEILERAGLELEPTDEDHLLRPSAVVFRAVFPSSTDDQEAA